MGKGAGAVKVTFDLIEKMHYEDFGKGDGYFKPSDILDMDDEE
jgi:hypothetical protein